LLLFFNYFGKLVLRSHISACMGLIFIMCPAGSVRREVACGAEDPAGKRNLRTAPPDAERAVRKTQ